MVFSKPYLRAFAFKLSTNKKALEFPKRDKLNSLLRTYLVKTREGYRPSFDDNITNIVLPIYGRSKVYPQSDMLPISSYRDVERDFEDLFFSLFHTIDSAGVLSYGKFRYSKAV